MVKEIGHTSNLPFREPWKDVLRYPPHWKWEKNKVSIGCTHIVLLSFIWFTPFTCKEIPVSQKGCSLGFWVLYGVGLFFVGNMLVWPLTFRRMYIFWIFQVLAPLLWWIYQFLEDLLHALSFLLIPQIPRCPDLKIQIMEGGAEFSMALYVEKLSY